MFKKNNVQVFLCHISVHWLQHNYIYIYYTMYMYKWEECPYDFCFVSEHVSIKHNTDKLLLHIQFNIAGLLQFLSQFFWETMYAIRWLVYQFHLIESSLPFLGLKYKMTNYIRISPAHILTTFHFGELHPGSIVVWMIWTCYY